MRTPSRTVTTGSAAGALTVITVWAVTAAFPAVVIPPEVSSAFTLLVTAAAAWIVPDPDRRPAQH